MTDTSQRLEAAASQLRAAFDGAFAEERARPTGAELDVLAIRVAGHGYALRLSEVLAVHAERKLTPVPSPARSLIGLVGVRGLVVPIYDLRGLLGYDPGPAPRWLALARAPAPLGFAFEAFEAHFRLPLDALVSSSHAPSGHDRFAQHSVKTEAGLRPLLHLPSLIESVTRQARPNRERQREERR